MHRKTDGFTILEVMVAILIMMIILAIVMVPLSQSFRSSSNTSKTANTSAVAQQVIEQVKGAWRVQANFDRNCISGLALPAATALAVQRVNEDGTLGSAETANTAASCGTAALATGFTPAVFKRVTVTSGAATDTTKTTLILDLRRPDQ